MRAPGLSKLWLICIAMAFTSVTKAMITPLVPLFSISLGASPVIVGLLVSVAFVLPLLLAMPIGSMVDRWGPTKLMMTGASAMVGIPCLLALIPDLRMLAAGQALLGLAHLMLAVSAQSFVASLGTEVTRIRYYGWYTTSLSAGQLVGPLLAGLLADAFGFGAAFITAGAISFITAAIVPWVRSTTPTDAASGPIRPFGRPGQVRLLIGNTGVRLALLVSSGVLFATSAYQAFMPVYLDALAYPATAVGLFFSLKGLSALIARSFMPGIVTLLRGEVRTMLLMVFVLAVGLLITGVVSNPLPLALIAVLVGGGSGISQPVSLVSVMNHVDKRERGFAVGFRLTGNRLAQVTSPLILGVIAELAGLTAAFAAAGVVLAILGLVYWQRPPNIYA